MDPAHVVIDDCEAEIVRRVFKWHVHDELSIRRIAKELTQCLPPPRGGNRWGETTVHRMLHNEAYIGTIYYYRWIHAPAVPKPEGGSMGRVARIHMVERPRSEWISVSVPPIIDRETFDRSCRAVGGGAQAAPGGGPEDGALDGLDPGRPWTAGRHRLGDSPRAGCISSARRTKAAKEAEEEGHAGLVHVDRKGVRSKPLTCIRCGGPMKIAVRTIRRRGLKARATPEGGSGSGDSQELRGKQAPGSSLRLPPPRGLGPRPGISRGLRQATGRRAGG